MIKKASLETKEIIELILATAALVIIIIFFVNLFSPKPNPDKEAAKSFFDTLKKTIAEAGATGSSFKIWGNDNVQIAYFGNLHIFGPYLKLSSRNILYKASHNYNRAICSCYIIDKKQDWNGFTYDKEAVCAFCINLNADKVTYATSISSYDDNPFFISPNENFQIFHMGRHYTFLKKQ